MQLLNKSIDFVEKLEKSWTTLSRREKQKYISIASLFLSVFIVFFVIAGIIFFPNVLALLVGVVIILFLLSVIIGILWGIVRMVLRKITGVEDNEDLY